VRVRNTSPVQPTAEPTTLQRPKKGALAAAGFSHV
jgi:hypothetical protein